MSADRTIAAIRADAATSDSARAEAAEVVASLTIGAFAEALTRLHASEDRALRIGVDLSEANRSRNIAIADLNATREKLTTAEAFRDSLQAEVDALKADQQEVVEACNAVAAERDWASAASADLRAEREAWKAEVAELRADRDALRAEVDKLRAPPRLDGDAEQLRCDLQSCRDENSTLIDRIAKVRAEAQVLGTWPLSAAQDLSPPPQRGLWDA